MFNKLTTTNSVWFCSPQKISSCTTFNEQDLAKEKSRKF